MWELIMSVTGDDFDSGIDQNEFVRTLYTLVQTISGPEAIKSSEQKAEIAAVADRLLNLFPDGTPIDTILEGINLALSQTQSEKAIEKADIDTIIQVIEKQFESRLDKAFDDALLFKETEPGTESDAMDVRYKAINDAFVKYFPSEEDEQQSKDLNTIFQDLKKRKNVLNEANKTFVSIVGETNFVQEGIDDLNQWQQKQEKVLSNLTKEMDNISEEYQALETRKQQLQQELDNLGNESKSLTEDISSLEAQENTLNKTIEGLGFEKTRLKGTLDNQKALASIDAEDFLDEIRHQASRLHDAYKLAQLQLDAAQTLSGSNSIQASEELSALDLESLKDRIKKLDLIIEKTLFSPVIAVKDFSVQPTQTSIQSDESSDESDADVAIESTPIKETSKSKESIRDLKALNVLSDELNKLQEKTLNLSARTAELNLDPHAIDKIKEAYSQAKNALKAIREEAMLYQTTNQKELAGQPLTPFPSAKIEELQLAVQLNNADNPKQRSLAKKALDKIVNSLNKDEKLTEETIKSMHQKSIELVGKVDRLAKQLEAQETHFENSTQNAHRTTLEMNGFKQKMAGQAQKPYDENATLMMSISVQKEKLKNLSKEKKDLENALKTLEQQKFKLEKETGQLEDYIAEEQEKRELSHQKADKKIKEELSKQETTLKEEHARLYIRKQEIEERVGQLKSEVASRKRELEEQVQNYENARESMKITTKASFNQFIKKGLSEPLIQMKGALTRSRSQNLSSLTVKDLQEIEQGLESQLKLAKHNFDNYRSGFEKLMSDQLSRTDRLKFSDQQKLNIKNEIKPFKLDENKEFIQQKKKYDDEIRNLEIELQRIKDEKNKLQQKAKSTALPASKIPVRQKSIEAVKPEQLEMPLQSTAKVSKEPVKSQKISGSLRQPTKIDLTEPKTSKEAVKAPTVVLDAGIKIMIETAKTLEKELQTFKSSPQKQDKKSLQEKQERIEKITKQKASLDTALDLYSSLATNLNDLNVYLNGRDKEIDFTSQDRESLRIKMERLTTTIGDIRIDKEKDPGKAINHYIHYINTALKKKNSSEEMGTLNKEVSKMAGPIKDIKATLDAYRNRNKPVMPGFEAKKQQAAKSSTTSKSEVTKTPRKPI